MTVYDYVSNKLPFKFGSLQLEQLKNELQLMEDVINRLPETIFREVIRKSINTLNSYLNSSSPTDYYQTNFLNTIKDLEDNIIHILKRLVNREAYLVIKNNTNVSYLSNFHIVIVR